MLSEIWVIDFGDISYQFWGVGNRDMRNLYVSSEYLRVYQYSNLGIFDSEIDFRFWSVGDLTFSKILAILMARILKTLGVLEMGSKITKKKQLQGVH